MSTLKQFFANIFSLADDDASMPEIIERIHSGATIKGTNMCILMLAIFIASIGLNMNSTATIIGAMLISPLMGNIIAIGYGMATYDLQYTKDSCLRLSLQIILSVFTSTVYFYLTPITTVSSELLARTSPTIWDVLIAICGGLAGIIGLTRQERGNVIPGVAIATSLMPPLCTAGYGIATKSFDFFWGALYLFFINGFFICLTAFIILKFINVPAKEHISDKQFRRTQLYLACFGIIVVLPSFYLANQSIRANLENVQAKNYIDTSFTSEVRRVVSYNLRSQEKILDVALLGNPLTKQEIELLQDQLTKRPNLKEYKLRITQNDNTGIKAGDVQSLIDQRLSDLQKTGIQTNNSAESAKYKALSDMYFPSYQKENMYNNLVQALNRRTPLAFPKVEQLFCGSLMSAQNVNASDNSNESTPKEITSNVTAETPHLGVIAYVNSPMENQDAKRLQKWISEEAGMPVILYVELIGDKAKHKISGSGIKTNEAKSTEAKSTKHIAKPTFGQQVKTATASK